MAENTKQTGTAGSQATKADPVASPAPLVKLERPLPIGTHISAKSTDQTAVILPDLEQSHGVIVVTVDAILAAAALVAKAMLDDTMTEADKLASFNRVYNWLGYADRPTLEDCTAKETLLEVVNDVLQKNAFALHPLNAHVV